MTDTAWGRLVEATQVAVGDAIRAAYRRGTRLAAIGPRSRDAAKFGHFGAGAAICFPQTVLMGERYMSIGDRVIVGPYCSLSVGIGEGQVPLLDPTLTIGDDTIIGRGCAIAAHYDVRIGREVWFAPECFVCDQHHGYTDVELPIGLQMAEAAPVVIGDRSWLGHGVVVLPGVTIGRHVSVAAGSVVTDDLPDFTVAVGAPARVVRRFDPDAGWVRVTSAAHTGLLEDPGP